MSNTQADLELVIKARDQTREAFRSLDQSISRSQKSMERMRDSTVKARRENTLFEKSLKAVAMTMGTAFVARALVSQVNALSVASLAMGNSTSRAIALGTAMESLKLSVDGTVRGVSPMGAAFANVMAKGSGLNTMLGEMENRLGKNTTSSIKAAGALAGLLAFGVAGGALNGVAGFERAMFGSTAATGPLLDGLKSISQLMQSTLVRNLSQVTGGFFGMEKSMNSVFGSFNKFQKLQNILDIVRQNVLSTVVAIGGLVAAGASLRTGFEFEKELSKSVTVAGLMSTQVRELRIEMKDLGLEVGAKGADLTKAFNLFKGGGIENAQEALDATSVVAKAAAYGMGDVADLATMTVSVMNAYGNEFSDAADVMGVFTAAVREGQAEVNQMVTSIPRVLGIANEFGVSFREVLSLIASMSRTGLPAAEAVTAVRQSIMDLIKPSRQGLNILSQYSKAGAKLFGQWDYSLQGIKDAIAEKGLLPTIEQLKGTLDELSFNRIFDSVEGYGGMSTLLGNMKDQAAGVYDAVNGADAEVFAKQWEEVQKSMSFAASRGIAVLNRALLDLATVVMPPVAAFFNFLADNYNNIVAFVKWMVTFALQMVNLAIATVAVNKVSAAFGGLFAIFANAPKFFIGMLTWFRSLGALMLSLIPLLPRLGALVITFGKDMRLAFLLFLKNPFMNFGKFMTVFATVFKVFSIFIIGNLLDIIVNLVAYGDMQVQVFGETFRIMDLMQAVWNVVSKKVGAFFSAMRDKWMPIMKEWTKGAVKAFMDFLTWAGNAIDGTIRFFGKLYRVITNLPGLVKHAADVAWRTLVDFFVKNLPATLAVVGKAISQALSGDADGALKTFRSALRDMQSGAGAFADSPELAAAKKRLDDFWATAIEGPPQKSAIDRFAEDVITEARRIRDAASLNQGPTRRGKTRGDGSSGGDGGDDVLGGAGDDKLADTLLDLRRTREELKLNTDEQLIANAVQKLGIEYSQRATLTGAKRAEYLAVEAEALKLIAAQGEERVRVIDLESQALIEAARLQAQYVTDPRQAKIELESARQLNEALRERRVLTDEETKAIRRRATAQVDSEIQSSLRQKAQDTRLETQEILQSLGVRYRSEEQYARETAKLRALNDLRREGIDLTSEEAQAYLKAVDERAAAEVKAGNQAVGFSEAMARRMDDMRKDVANIGSTIADRTMSAIDQLSDAFTDFFMGQKIGWRDLASSILKDIARIIIKMLVLKAVMWAMRAAGVPIPGFARGASFDSSMDDAALQGFAKGGQFTNSIVSRPTPFKFARGGVPSLGVMGEAGPEAVMPLTRMSNGALGVQAQGGGSSAPTVFAPNITINVQSSNGDQAMDRALAADIAHQVKTMVRIEMQQFYQQQQRASRGLNSHVR